jgi:hypothetical protein
MKGMRAFAVAVTALLMGSLFAAPAAASCAPPASVAENAARAVAVIHGTIIQAQAGALTVRVDRALKGSLAGSLRVFAGPGRGGAGGSAVATSVDYPDLGGPAAVGSDHVLYLIRGTDGELETNACIGSHPGAPSPDERTFFGAGTAPGRGTSAPEPLTPPETALSIVNVLLIWLLASLAVAGGAIALARRRRAV